MPLYTIETTYRLPVYRQRTYEAPTSDAACEIAIADEGWGDGKEDVETSGETYVSGIWEGTQAYAGTSISVPDWFDETIQRKSDVFDDLLALLKEPARPIGLTRHEFERWLPRATATITKAEAIVADARGGR